MEAHSATIINQNGSSGNVQTNNRKEVKKGNFISNDTISVISVRDVSGNNGIQENAWESKKKGAEGDETALKRLGMILVFSLWTVVISVSSVVPWTTFQRTNSIFYQSYWPEVLIPAATYWILAAVGDLLNLTIWTKERSLISFKLFLRLFFMYMTPYTIFYILGYSIWSVYLGLNHPLPWLGMALLPAWMAFAIELWFFLPSKLMANDDFRRKVKMYIVYFFWIVALVFQNEFLSYLFSNLSTTFQFLVPFFVAACREFDKRVRTKLVNKMMGKQDEPASALLAITVSSFYTFFMAIRLTGATYATVSCFVSIDFMLHSHATYKLIHEYKKIKPKNSENGYTEFSIKIKTLILEELVEGFTPLIYGICMATAYYGPNAKLLVTIGSELWGEPIEDIDLLFMTMGLLFLVDTLGSLINSFFLWKAMKINILKEFRQALGSYWLFMAIRLGYSLSTYFASLEVNLGSDSSGRFIWISPQGRLSLIQNSTELTDEEKSMFLANTTLI